MLLGSLDSGILFAIDSMFYNKLNLSISNALLPISDLLDLPCI
jgi:hypothetical protein